MFNLNQYYCLVQKKHQCFRGLLKNNQIFKVKIEKNQQISFESELKLAKQLKFFIFRTQISNKVYKFFIKLLSKDDECLNLIIDGKQSLNYHIKQLSFNGILSGLRQLLISCQKAGQGSFAQVYKVITNYDQVMALKAFDKKALKINKNKLAYENQLNLLRQIQSPYVVSLDGLFETQKNIYLKMQYFPLSLKHYIKKNHPTIKTQKNIMRMILLALYELQKKNIIHRDLKPDNIMIRGKDENSMQCVIIDFGLGTQAHANKYIFTRCGTPGFLSPQIANMNDKKQKLTTKCDMFSLGCIFYFILTKKYIFQGANINEIVKKNKNTQINESKFQSMSKNQKELLNSMLAKDPQKRIKPKQALNHDYFNDEVDDNDQIPQQLCDLDRKMKNVQSFNPKQSSITASPCSFKSKFSLNSSMIKKSINKDSCLTFQGPTKFKQIQQPQKVILNDQKQYTRGGQRKVSRFSHLTNPIYQL